MQYKNINLPVSDLLDRFVRYTSTGTQSNMKNADSGIFPSTESQKKFAQELYNEIKKMGISEVELDKNYYVLARIPASLGYETKESFGLCAHYDTASDAPGEQVKPIIHKAWDGSAIQLNENIVIDPASDKELATCLGHTIITSDGTSLLGADDKAGIAGILTLAQILIENPTIKHGPIEILFSPDEETGHGMDFVPLNKLKSKAFYTVDGGQEGEVETECFNAWKSELTFTGRAAHLGAARGKMINAISMASHFISCLPAQESPEATDGYYGFFCPLQISGSTEKAQVTVFLRDFDQENMNKRLSRVESIARSIEAQFDGGIVTVEHTHQYSNMKAKIDEKPEVATLLLQAVKNAGIEPRIKPIRGGTDGSRLTEMGIPTPNIFTGGHNYHSRREWASLEQMTNMLKTLLELTQLWGEK